MQWTDTDGREKLDGLLDEMADEFEQMRHSKWGPPRDPGAPPSWWDEDEAGAEALALGARLRAGKR